MTDLLAEMGSAARDVRQVHLDRLRGLGVPISWLADAFWHEPYPEIGLGPAPLPPFGVSCCESVGGGLYQPGEGPLHVLLPVVEDGALVDLCAFRSADPGNWLLRVGNGWALGMDLGLSPHLWGPVHVFSDPLDWLRGCGEGVAVLDWDSPEIRRQLDAVPEVVCSTPAVASVLTRALTRPVRIPKISIKEARNVA